MAAWFAQWRRRLASLTLVVPLLAGSGGAFGEEVDPATGATADAIAGTVMITGLQSINEDAARDAIRLQIDYIEKYGASNARADDAAYFLELAMRERGFDRVTVTWSRPSDTQVLLEVREGRLFQLGTITCLGNEAISDRGVAELLTSATRERLDLDMDAEIPYVDRDLEAGRLRVEEYYDLLGFLNATVALSRPANPGDQTNDELPIQVTVREGQIHRVGRVELPQPPEPNLASEIEAIRSEYEGQIYSPTFPAQIQLRLRQMAVDAGYLDADGSTIASEPVAAGDHLRVDLKSHTDFGVKYRVTGLRVAGVEKVNPGYVERRFARFIDEPYQPAGISETVSDALATGAFRRVTVNPTVVEGAAAELELDIEVEETKAQELAPFGGYGTYEGAILGLEYRHYNLFGIVRRFESRVEGSQRGVVGQATYTDPWFLGSQWQAAVGVFGRLRQHEGYQKLENGLRAEFERVLFEDNRLTLILQSSYTDITDAEIEQPFLGAESYLDSFVGFAFSRRKLDDPVNPRKGYEFETATGIGGSVLGGDFDYVRSSGKFGYHLPLGPTTLHLAARAGAIFGQEGEDKVLPIDLRFFSGGANSVRSFADRELGPSDPRDYPVGGEFYTIFNVEYEIPVFGPVSLAVFGDAGNLLSDFGDAGLTDMHYAAGVGLRVTSPLGPLRLDYGHNLNRGEGEPGGAFHIGFGVAF